MAVHTKSFYSEDKDFDVQVGAWLNSFTQPIDIIIRSAGALTLVIARDAESPSAAAALLAEQVLAAAALLASSTHTVPASPDGTMLPDDTNLIVDSRGGVWTLGNGNVVLLNHRDVLAAQASKLLYLHGNVYAFGNDLNWYLWVGETSTWVVFGPVQPV